MIRYSRSNQMSLIPCETSKSFTDEATILVLGNERESTLIEARTARKSADVVCKRVAKRSINGECDAWAASIHYCRRTRASYSST